MPLLRAIKDIPSSVSAISAGMQFYEPNRARADEYIAAGWAQRVNRVDEPALLQPKMAATVNSRGWDGLMWDGATVAIIASGPSLTETQCKAIRAWRDAAPESRKAIVVNTSFRLAPWADVLYAADARWWKCVEDGVSHYTEARKHFRADQLWSCDRAVADLGLNMIRVVRSPGLGKEPGVIHSGDNGAYQALNLAYQAGAVRVLLVGLDCRDIGGRKHWHGDHPTGLNVAKLPYATWIKNFDRLAPDCAAAGFPVINATPNSALTCFVKIKLSEALT